MVLRDKEMMVPTGNPRRRSFDSYGGRCYGAIDDSSSARSSRVHMAEAQGEETTGEEEVGTSSKGKEREEEEEWLRLSIGRNTNGAFSSQGGSKPKTVHVEQSNQRGNLYQSTPSVTAPPRTQVFSPQVVSSYPTYSQDLNWGTIWCAQSGILAQPPPALTYSTGQFSSGISVSTARGQNSAATTGVRVVSPPLRSYAGVWFLLQASLTQVREPFLPQIPKCYLRIKDGKMTVRLLMKYLVNKLSLNDESEVEIRCRGQQLHPLMTLKQVRDCIWCTRDTMQILPDLPGHHVMTLLYGRSS